MNDYELTNSMLRNDPAGDCLEIDCLCIICSLMAYQELLHILSMLKDAISAQDICHWATANYVPWGNEVVDEDASSCVSVLPGNRLQCAFKVLVKSDQDV